MQSPRPPTAAIANAIASHQPQCCVPSPPHASAPPSVEPRSKHTTAPTTCHTTPHNESLHQPNHPSSKTKHCAHYDQAKSIKSHSPLPSTTKPTQCPRATKQSHRLQAVNNVASPSASSPKQTTPQTKPSLVATTTIRPTTSQATRKMTRPKPPQACTVPPRDCAATLATSNPTSPTNHPHQKPPTPAAGAIAKTHHETTQPFH